MCNSFKQQNRTWKMLNMGHILNATEISIWWHNHQLSFFFIETPLFLQDMCAQILNMPGVYLQRLIHFISFLSFLCDFSVVESVWINNTPLHNTYINARSIYTHPFIKLQKNMKNNGSEWNRKYDVFSWFWWLTIHIGKISVKPSHHIDQKWQGCFVLELNHWSPRHALLHMWEMCSRHQTCI